MSGNRPVYSTSGGGDLRKGKGDDASSPGFSRGQGPAKMRLETGGRGGKAVTVLFNLPMDEAAARSMMKEMQGKFGCGATMKNGPGGSTIELRGDVRDRVDAFFAQRDLKIVRAGGR